MELALIRDLTFSRMKARYRRTFAGFFWVILSPIIMYSAQALVFKHILKIGLPNYTLFLLGGLLPWIFVTTALETGIPVLQSSRDLLTGFKIRPEALVFSSVLDNWINFLASFIIMLVPFLFLEKFHPVGFLMAPVAIAQLLIGVGGLVFFLSVLNVFYRDTRFIVHFSISILFFATPIFYPKEFLPSAYRWAIELNPIYALITPIRICIYDFTLRQFLIEISRAIVVSTALVWIAFRYWKKRRNEFYVYL